MAENTASKVDGLESLSFVRPIHANRACPNLSCCDLGKGGGGGGGGGSWNLVEWHVGELEGALDRTLPSGAVSILLLYAVQ